MDGSLPKYEQIAYDIRLKILSGKYQRNEQLPLEREMETEYGVSRITIKRAVDILVQEGYVIKRRGAGTFVKDFDESNLNERTDSFKGFSESFAGHKIKTNVLLFTIEKSSAFVTEKLALRQPDYVYHIERVRYVDGKPMTYQTTFIPIASVMSLRLDGVVDSLYTYIEEKEQLTIQSAHKTISATMPTKEEQIELQVPADFPLLNVESLVYLDTGQIFEYTSSKYRSDRYSYHAVEIRN